MQYIATLDLVLMVFHMNGLHGRSVENHDSFWSDPLVCRLFEDMRGIKEIKMLIEFRKMSTNSEDFSEEMQE